MYIMHIQQIHPQHTDRAINIVFGSWWHAGGLIYSHFPGRAPLPQSKLRHIIDISQKVQSVIVWTPRTLT